MERKTSNMWIFKNDAFVSIVEDRDMPDQLWARARVRGDLERFFGRDGDVLDVIQTDDADYRFRCAVDREMVKRALVEAVDQLDYVNFKSSIATGKAGDDRHHAYLRVWTAMSQYQRDQAALEKLRDRKPGKKKGPRS